MAQIVITNEKLYDEEVNEVRADGLVYLPFTKSFDGTIEIVTWDNDVKTFTGEHGEHDYEEYYGFVIQK